MALVDCPEYEMVAVGEAIQPNRWNHLAGSYDGKTVRVYVNGVQTGSLESTFEIGTFKSPLYIGASSYGPKLLDYFTGKIDEVKVYSLALSGDQIASRYQAEKDLRISKLTRLMAEVSKFENRDTTPPAIKQLSPPPDSTVTGKATDGANSFVAVQWSTGQWSYHIQNHFDAEPRTVSEVITAPANARSLNHVYVYRSNKKGTVWYGDLSVRREFPRMKDTLPADGKDVTAHIAGNAPILPARTSRVFHVFTDNVEAGAGEEAGAAPARPRGRAAPPGRVG